MSKQSICTINFSLVCLASLLFSASYNMLIPELPAYLSQLGGAEYKGLIISLFTLTAGLSRPFSGKLTDTIGRKPVMLFGALVCVVCGFLYPVLLSVSGFLLLRLFHGFSTGFTPTAITTYVADITSKDRWGEALGIQSVFFSTGLALGPALGSFIKLQYSYNALFYGSSLMALLAMLLVYRTQETLQEQQSFRWSSLKITKNEILAIEVLPAAIVTFLTYVAFGVVLTLIPDWTDHLGIINKGTFFIYFTLSSVLVRFIAGKLSDRYGRLIMMKIGLLLLTLSLCCIAYYQHKTGLLLGATAYGLAMGVLSPAINAWTIDMSLPKQRGKAIATMFIALEVGIGLGALCSGWYYLDHTYRIPHVFYGCALLSLIGLGYLFLKRVNK